MSKISIICVTKRPGAIDVLHQSLRRQTFIDFEVICADELYGERPERSVRWFHFKPRKKDAEDVWNINKAYNDCLELARGELLVFLQDFIWIPDDGLQRFWDLYHQYPKSLISGVGHKAKDGLKGVSEVDRRIEATEGISYSWWELNWAACPRAIMPTFNEKMDRYYGGENQYVAKLALHRGAGLIIDKTNECIGYSQKHCGGRPEDWETNHANKEGRQAAFLEYLNLTEPPIDKGAANFIVKTKDGGIALSHYSG